MLTVPSGRGRTRPVTAMQNSLRSVFGDGEGGGAVGIAHHLHQALAVAQVDEDDAAVVAAAMDPAHQRDGLAEDSGGRCGRSSRCVSRQFSERIRVAVDVEGGDGRARPLRRGAEAQARGRPLPRSISRRRACVAASAAAPVRRRATQRRVPRARRDHAHRDDVLQRLVDRHVELAHAATAAR